LLSASENFSKLTEESHSHGKLNHPVVSDLPTRGQIHEWLVNPPEPPFTIAIAESGQKHILPWAQEAYSREYFPVQFEHDCVYINAKPFQELLATYESLMGMDFTKKEIDSGSWQSQKLRTLQIDLQFIAWWIYCCTPPLSPTFTVGEVDTERVWLLPCFGFIKGGQAWKQSHSLTLR
jgi:hypothetical protein